MIKSSKSVLNLLTFSLFFLKENRNDSLLPNCAVLDQIFKRVFVTFFLFSSYFSSVIIAQTDVNEATPKVGKPFPNFTFSHVEHYSKNKVTLSDFKDRWLVLDFWSKGCINCVQSFPKLNDIQKELKDSLKILLVGINDIQYNAGIREMFEKFRIKQNLLLSMAYDSMLWKPYGVKFVPYIFVINPNGILHSIHTSSSFTKETLKGIVSAQVNSNDTGKQAINNISQKLINLDSSFLYGSFFSQYNKQSTWDNNTDLNNGYFHKKSHPLIRLYNYAYIGQSFLNFEDPLYKEYYVLPILETTDSALFRFDYGTNLNIFDYTLAIPNHVLTEKQVRQNLQRDLQFYFKFDALVETREMPVWILIATSKARQKLKTKGVTNRKGKIDAGGINVTNASINLLLERINYSLYPSPTMNLVDGTEINSNIDINLDAILTDFEDVKRGLQKNGLDLVLGKKEMKVIVIRDSPSKGN